MRCSESRKFSRTRENRQEFTQNHGLHQKNEFFTDDVQIDGKLVHPEHTPFTEGSPCNTLWTQN